MVERHPSKLNVSGSNPLFRSNGLEYIRARVSERKKNRKSNPRGREVGTLLVPISAILQDSADVFLFPCSSMAEHGAVNSGVLGSSPSGGVSRALL